MRMNELNYREFLTAALLVILFCIATFRRNFVWKNWLALWGDTLRKSPNKQRPYICMGDAYVKKGQIDAAIDIYKKAISFNPNNFLVHNNLAAAYGENGQIDLAIAAFEKALGIKSDAPHTRYNLGLAYEKKGLFRQAADEYIITLKLNPKDNEARRGLQRLCGKL